MNDGWIDVSVPVYSDMVHWPDNPPAQIERLLDIERGDVCNVSKLSPGAHTGTHDAPTRRFLVQVADAAAARWEDADQGIWEVRGGPRHFLYSKLMCWAALDCAIAVAGKLGAGDRVSRWTETRERIREAILARGWSEKDQAFAQSFGSDELDASALVMPLVGFHPATDPRMRATIDAIRGRLADERGLVFRYCAQDGLEGGEGTFLLCTFWLAQAQAMAGELAEARATFANAVAFVSDVGLPSEEVDETTGDLLGNFPQAFSHIGLVNAAWAIAQAEQQGQGVGLSRQEAEPIPAVAGRGQSRGPAD